MAVTQMAEDDEDGTVWSFYADDEEAILLLRGKWNVVEVGEASDADGTVVRLLPQKGA